MRDLYLGIVLILALSALPACAQTARVTARGVTARAAAARPVATARPARPAEVDPRGAPPPHVQARKEIAAAVAQKIAAAGKGQVPARTPVLEVGPGKAYPTIQAAVAAAPEDGWIRIAPGVYQEEVHSNVTKNGYMAWHKRVHLVGVHAERVVLQTPRRHQGTALTLGRGSTVRNLTIRGSQVGVEFAEGAGTLEGVRLVDDTSGVRAYSIPNEAGANHRSGWRSSVLEVHGCLFERTEVGIHAGTAFGPVVTRTHGSRFSRFQTALVLSRGDHSVKANSFEDGTATAVSIQGQGQPVTERPVAAVEGNSFWKVKAAVMVVAARAAGVNDNVIDGSALAVSLSSRDQSPLGPCEVLRNRIVKSSTTALAVDGEQVLVESNLVADATSGVSLRGTAVAVYNNTMWKISGDALTVGCAPGARSLAARNNIFAEVGRELTLQCPSAQLAGVATGWGRNLLWKVRAPGTAPGRQPDDRTADPWFGNAGAGIFRLLPGSPAIDRGLNVPLKSTRDVSGLPRKRGSAYDLGAFESR